MLCDYFALLGTDLPGFQSQLLAAIITRGSRIPSTPLRLGSKGTLVYGEEGGGGEAILQSGGELKHLGERRSRRKGRVGAVKEAEEEEEEEEEDDERHRWGKRKATVPVEKGGR